MRKNMIYYISEKFAKLFVWFFSVFNRTTLFKWLSLKLCKNGADKSGGLLRSSGEQARFSKSSFL